MGRYVVDSQERFGYVRPLRPKCPELWVQAADDEYYYTCTLDDRACVYEYNDKICEVYRDFLKEEE